MSWTHSTRFVAEVNVKSGPDGWFQDLRLATQKALRDLEQNVRLAGADEVPESLSLTVTQNQVVEPRYTVQVSVDGLEDA